MSATAISAMLFWTSLLLASMYNNLQYTTYLTLGLAVICIYM